MDGMQDIFPECEFCEVDGHGNHAPRCPVYLEAKIETLELALKVANQKWREYQDEIVAQRAVRQVLMKSVDDTYYRAQANNARKYIEAIKDHPPESQLELLRSQVVDNACCFVHGANFMAVMLEIKELREKYENPDRNSATEHTRAI